jgi:hypothetical protein
MVMRGPYPEEFWVALLPDLDFSSPLYFPFAKAYKIMSSTASLCVVGAAALLLLVLGLGAPGSEAANCTNQKRRKDN